MFQHIHELSQVVASLLRCGNPHRSACTGARIGSSCNRRVRLGGFIVGSSATFVSPIHIPIIVVHLLTMLRNRRWGCTSYRIAWNTTVALPTEAILAQPTGRPRAGDLLQSQLVHKSRIGMHLVVGPASPEQPPDQQPPPVPTPAPDAPRQAGGGDKVQGCGNPGRGRGRR